MKLVFCSECQDVIRLQEDIRRCKCGKSGGLYEPDGLHAHYWADAAIPIGFSNPSLAYAVEYQPRYGLGVDFYAFVIPEKCDTFEQHSESPTLAPESYGEAFLALLHKKYVFYGAALEYVQSLQPK